LRLRCRADIHIELARFPRLDRTDGAAPPLLAEAIVLPADIGRGEITEARRSSRQTTACPAEGRMGVLAARVREREVIVAGVDIGGLAFGR
jgi:hypothetical protein